MEIKINDGELPKLKEKEYKKISCPICHGTTDKIPINMKVNYCPFCGKEQSILLKDDIEYILIENIKTKELITKITKNEVKTISDIVVRVKFIEIERD